LLETINDERMYKAGLLRIVMKMKTDKKAFEDCVRDVTDELRLDPDDFHFVFGKPFGRPEEIFRDFVIGKIDTAILREPEASFAIAMMKEEGKKKRPRTKQQFQLRDPLGQGCFGHITEP